MNATDGKYVILHEWTNQLGLSANEKIALALVYGFTMKDGCSCVKNACVQEWLGCTKKTAINVMDSLEEKGLIIHGQEIINGKISNTYKLGEEKLLSMGVKITPQGCKNYTVGVKKIHRKGEKITPYKDNNKDNYNIIIVEDAHVHAYEEVLDWICDNEDGLQMMLHRNGLISAKTPAEEMREIIRPYVKEYYEQQQMNGGDDIQRRGRRDIKQHFMQWLPKHLKKQKEEEQQQKQIGNGKQSNSVATAMQQLIEGMENARRSQR